MEDDKPKYNEGYPLCRWCVLPINTDQVPVSEHEEVCYLKPKDAAEIARNAETRRKHLWDLSPPVLVTKGEVHEKVRFQSPQNIAAIEYHAHLGRSGQWIQCFFQDDGKCSLNPATYPDLGPPMQVAKPSEPKREIPGEIVLYPAQHIRSYQLTGKRDAMLVLYKDGKVAWWCTQEDLMRYAVTLAKLTGIDEPLPVPQEPARPQNISPTMVDEHGEVWPVDEHGEKQLLPNPKEPR